jgi:hypothetical protein
MAPQREVLENSGRRPAVVSGSLTEYRGEGGVGRAVCPGLQRRRRLEVHLHDLELLEQLAAGFQSALGR